MPVDGKGRSVPDGAPDGAALALPVRVPVGVPAEPVAGRTPLPPPGPAPAPPAVVVDEGGAPARARSVAGEQQPLLRALDGPTPLVDVEDVRVLGALPSLPPIVVAALDAHLLALTEALGLLLHRTFGVREVVDTCVPDESGHIYLSASPVQVVDTVTQGGVGVGIWGQDAPPPSAYWWRPGYPVIVTYQAGIDASSTLGRAVRGAVAAKALPYARSLLARDAAEQSGTVADPGTSGGTLIPAPPQGVKAFTVEGLNVTFESTDEAVTAAARTAVEVAATARWSPEELAALGPARRVVAL